MKKNFQVNTFHNGLKAWMDFTVIVYVKEVIWSMHFQSIKRNMTIKSGNPSGIRAAI